MKNLKEEYMKQSSRYNDAITIKNQLKTQNQNLQAKKSEAQLCNERINNNYLAGENQLKLVETQTKMTDNLQENKEKLKKKEIELESILNNYKEEYDIIEKALKKVQYESLDNKKNASPSKNYFNKESESVISTKSISIFSKKSPRSQVTDEIQILTVNGSNNMQSNDVQLQNINYKMSKIESNNGLEKDNVKLVSDSMKFDFKNIFDLLHKSRNLRTGISDGSKNNYTANGLQTNYIAVGLNSNYIASGLNSNYIASGLNNNYSQPENNHYSPPKNNNYSPPPKNNHYSPPKNNNYS